MLPFTLDEKSVVVRWIDVEDICESDWPRLKAVLSDEERARSERFHFSHDREVYIAGHALVRAMLSTIVPKSLETWAFTFNDYDKPEAVMPLNAPKVRFNLSHTRGLAAVAMGLNFDLGIDVETRKRTNLTLALADRFFAPSEVRMLKNLPESKVNTALFSLWTLKEAFIKAVGMGLSIPLDSFAFDLDPFKFTLKDANADEWFFKQLSPSDEYALAIALRHSTPENIDIKAGAVRTRDLFI